MESSGTTSIDARGCDGKGDHSGGGFQFKAATGLHRVVRDRKKEKVMLSSGSMEDRWLIRELVESYNDAVMRFDGEAWASNWTEDAVWHLPGAGDVQGRATILTVWQGAMSAFGYVGFFASAGPIHVDGDTATGTWYQQEFLHGKDGSQRSVTGRYRDDYIKQDGRWYFKRRVYEVLNSETKD